MYQVEYSIMAIKALRRVPANIRHRIVLKIEALAEEPLAPNNNVKKLKGREGFRLRVGDWRVLYELKHDRLVILVLDAGPRGGIYE